MRSLRFGLSTMPICTQKGILNGPLKFGGVCTALLVAAHSCWASPVRILKQSRTKTIRLPRAGGLHDKKWAIFRVPSLHRLRNRLKLKFIRTLLEGFGKAHEFYSAMLSAICILRGAHKTSCNEDVFEASIDSKLAVYSVSSVQLKSQ